MFLFLFSSHINMVTIKILAYQIKYFNFRMEIVSDYKLDLLFILLQIYSTSDNNLVDYYNTFSNSEFRYYF